MKPLRHGLAVSAALLAALGAGGYADVPSYSIPRPGGAPRKLGREPKHRDYGDAMRTQGRFYTPKLSRRMGRNHNARRGGWL